MSPLDKGGRRATLLREGAPKDNGVGKARFARLHGMKMRESEIDTLARHLIEGLISRGVIKPRSEPDALVSCVVEMMSAHFEEDSRLEDEAERLAEQEARKDPSLDIGRLRTLIKQKLAQKKNFPV